MKHKKIIAAVLICSSFLIGCGKNKNNPAPSEKNPAGTTGMDNPSTVTSPSKVNDELTLIQAFGEKGSWIITPTSDITTSKEIVVQKLLSTPEGKKGRNISLYATNEKQEVTNTYTLKAPKMLIQSDDTELKRGTFIGDIYVHGNNFKITDTKVEGNIYFETQEAKDTFKLEGDAKVTGVQELKK